jgi:hypothetical protein
MTSILLDFRNKQLATRAVSKDSKTYKKRVNLFGTLKSTTINDLIHLFDIAHSEFVDIIFDENDIDMLISFAKK